MSRSTSVILVTLGLFVTSRAADAALTTDGCLVLKRQAWGNLRKCEITEQTKALKGKPADLAKCQAKLQEKLTKITEKATDAAIACRYGDNGDGTVTDYDTGLQWEKKTGRFVINVGFVCLTNDGHCVNDIYEWSEAHAYIGGTTADGHASVPFLAGHSDWRLPSSAELLSIVAQPCSANPCIDPIFGPTIANAYWSATSQSANFAYHVLFAVSPFGNLGGGTKNILTYVRAVRNGL